MKCLVVLFSFFSPVSAALFIQYKESAYFPVFEYGPVFSFLAVGAVLWPCEQGPGWKCTESGLDCTIPPPPAASSAETLRNWQPPRSWAALTRRDEAIRQITHNFSKCRQNVIASCKFYCIFFLPCPSLAGWRGTDWGHALHWSAVQQMNL